MQLFAFFNPVLSYSPNIWNKVKQPSDKFIIFVQAV